MINATKMKNAATEEFRPAAQYLSGARGRACLLGRRLQLRQVSLFSTGRQQMCSCSVSNQCAACRRWLAALPASHMMPENSRPCRMFIGAFVMRRAR